MILAGPYIKKKLISLQCEIVIDKPSDFDNLREFLRLSFQGIPESAESRHELVAQLHSHGNVHSGGVRVVGALGFVHVIVGVYWRFAPQFATQYLDRAVCNYLVLKKTLLSYLWSYIITGSSGTAISPFVKFLSESKISQTFLKNRF